MAKHGSLIIIRHVRGVALTAPWVLWLLLADVALSLMLPFKRLTPRLVYDLSSRLAASVWTWIQFIFVHVNGADIACSGDTLPAGESAIVIANHVAWADFYLIQALAQRATMLGRCRYFAKLQLRLVPFLGWGLWAMGMPMVSRTWLKDKSQLDHAFPNIVSGGFPTWLVSFSEATRFSKKKYEESQVWCKRTDRPHPMHLLYPRTKGFIATVQTLRKAPHVKAVYDLTIFYRHGDKFQEAPSMWDTMSVPGLSQEAGYQFYVHARRFPMELLPQKDEDLAKWLEQRWIEKGEWLEAQRQKCLSSSTEVAQSYGVDYVLIDDDQLSVCSTEEVRKNQNLFPSLKMRLMALKHMVR